MCIILFPKETYGDKQPSKSLLNHGYHYKGDILPAHPNSLFGPNTLCNWDGNRKTLTLRKCCHTNSHWPVTHYIAPVTVPNNGQLLNNKITQVSDGNFILASMYRKQSKTGKTGQILSMTACFKVLVSVTTNGLKKMEKCLLHAYSRSTRK